MNAKHRFLALSLVVAAASLAITGAAHAGQLFSMQNFVMAGSQEVPSNGSTAVCSGVIEVDTLLNQLYYNISFAGVGTETAAHIHGPAPRGVNAGVLLALPLGNPKVGTWNYPQAQEANILAGNIYMNIHSAAFPGGEMRGQIEQLTPLDASLKFTAVNYAMAGSQEVPPNASTAVCAGVIEVDTLQNKLYYNLSHNVVNETAAHIHGPAARGVNAGVLLALPTGNPKVGTWNYPQAQEANILAGTIYMNIHSTAFPGGEIRGQIDQLIPFDRAPSLGTWGRIALVLGLLALGMLFIVRRRRAQAAA